jgi:hypothetical protein
MNGRKIAVSIVRRAKKLSVKRCTLSTYNLMAEIALITFVYPAPIVI